MALAALARNASTERAASMRRQLGKESWLVDKSGDFVGKSCPDLVTAVRTSKEANRVIVFKVLNMQRQFGIKQVKDLLHILVQVPHGAKMPI